ncbi:HEAT repeat domain-containing protein [bacterium]|nr:HEAT repeat domain-containing protein [bacterium]
MINSAEQFRSLRESEDPDEYRRAAHDEAPVEVWLDVVTRMPDMRFWVAQNKTVPVAVLEQLADDPNSRVRDMVARKRKIPETLQIKLAADTEPSVRSALAYNAKVTARVLAMLIDDDDQTVRDAAQRRADDAS